MKLNRISMLFLLILYGASRVAYAAEMHDHEHHHEDHHHEHTAPHNGTLIVFGDEFAHLEFVLDQETGSLTAYALDGEAEKAVRLSQPSLEVMIVTPEAKDTIQLYAVSSLLTGESVGNTSQFSTTSSALVGAEHFEAIITKVEIKGQTFENVSFLFPEGNE